ncbi:MAG: hypothetical protein AAGG79_00475 [Pseudomonadota bacterium]
MTKAPLFRRASLLLSATLLTGCSLFGWKDDGGQFIFVETDQSPSPQQLCETTALAEERRSALQRVEGAETTGSRTGRTFLQDKLNAYEAEMEIAYRGMVSSCNLYANCLDRNSGVETACLRSEDSYNDARRQFFAMVGQADALAAEVEIARAEAARAANRRHRRGARGYAPSAGAQSTGDGGCQTACATTGNIFTSTCCPVDSGD